MGRGRQKAKQTKVARELKYYAPQTDLQALQRELGTANSGPGPRYAEPQHSSDEFDDLEEDDWSRRSG